MGLEIQILQVQIQSIEIELAAFQTGLEVPHVAAQTLDTARSVGLQEVEPQALAPGITRQLGFAFKEGL